MNEYGLEEAIRNLRNRDTRLEHEGDLWTVDERERLENLFYEGKGISEIAIRLQRTEPAVFQQIEKMDLYQRKSNPQRRKFFEKSGSCLCQQCEANRSMCPLHNICEEKEVC